MQRNGAHDLAMLVIRLSGLYLAFGHGWSKIVRLATGEGAGIVSMADNLGFPLPIVFAWALALAEFGGGICVALGFGTRVAASFAAVAMFVAAFRRHRAIMQLLTWIGLANPTDEELRAAGDPERAILYLLALLVVLIAGPGRYSVDARLAARRR